MQDKAKKNKKKRPLIYKPYKKGVCCTGVAVRKGLRILAYYLLFAFLYLILGATLQFENMLLRVICNGVLVLVCAMLLYMDGARLGESETALGEIAYMQEQKGKGVSQQDLAHCYHPLKGLFILLVGIAPLLLLTVPHALLAQKQVYVLQGLPSWLSAFDGHEEVSLPLAYYQRDYSLGMADILRVIVRLLIFPFTNIATGDNADAMLLVDHLSPLLVCLPALGFPLGYMTGPLARAMVHGDISSSNKRRLRKERKARKERAAKKNEII